MRQRPDDHRRPDVPPDVAMLTPEQRKAAFDRIVVKALMDHVIPLWIDENGHLIERDEKGHRIKRDEAA